MTESRSEATRPIAAREVPLGLPPASELQDYGQVDPNLPLEIWQEIRGVLHHRLALELAASRRADRGQLIGFLVAVAFLAVSAWLINGGEPLAGVILGSVDLVALVTVFVVGRRT
jgi:uncharacterized membrane protein